MELFRLGATPPGVERDSELSLLPFLLSPPSGFALIALIGAARVWPLTLAVDSSRHLACTNHIEPPPASWFSLAAAFRASARVFKNPHGNDTLQLIRSLFFAQAWVRRPSERAIPILDTIQNF